MEIKLAPHVVSSLKEINKKNPRLSQRIHKQLKLFSTNAKHPSLRTHKLSGELSNRWSISITNSIRMTYLQRPDQAYFISLGTHDQVYRK